MKQCKKCSVDLVVGENWRSALERDSDYRCAQCVRDYKNARNNTPKGKSDLKHYNKINRPSIKKHQLKTPAGIYGVFYDCKLVYIGESKKPSSRKCDHFTIAGSKGGIIEKSPSEVAKALGRGELQHDKLRFKMLEFIDDTDTRKAREKCLIQRYKPLYN